MLPVVPKRRWWYLFSGITVTASIIVIIVWRFNFGIDFIGGSLSELEFIGQRPASAEIQRRFEKLGARQVRVQLAGDRSAIIRSTPLSSDVHQVIVASFANEAQERRYESIGPSIGQELARKTIVAVILSIIAIICYVAWAFRRVGREVSAWLYGSTAIISLAHDVVIPMGVFAVLGRFMSVEIDAPFIAAVLTILGYSVNDTIIIFDRVRENVLTLRGKSFAEVVNISVNQTFARSTNTTLTTLLALLAVVLFGGSTVRYFALALMIGIGVGAYSSIFIAAPLLVTWYERKRKQ